MCVDTYSLDVAGSYVLCRVCHRLDAHMKHMDMNERIFGCRIDFEAPFDLDPAPHRPWIAHDMPPPVNV
jgi:hypothetical protein